MESARSDLSRSAVFERTAGLLERRRSQNLLDQELVRIANRNDLHRATILAWPAAAQIRPGRPTSLGESWHRPQHARSSARGGGSTRHSSTDRGPKRTE